MKYLLLFSLLFVSTTILHAKEAPTRGSLKSGDLFTYTASSVELVGIKIPPPDCPPNAMCTPAAFAVLNISLNGCMDRVLSIASNKVMNTEGKMVLNVAVTAVSTKASRTTRCIVQKTEQFDVLLGMPINESDVVLNNLAQSPSKPPIYFP